MSTLADIIPGVKTRRELQNKLSELETEKVDLVNSHNAEYRKVVGQFQQYVLDQSNIRRLSLDVIY